jgi:hypothetical protein
MATAFQIDTQRLLPWIETADYIVATSSGDGDTFCLTTAARYDRGLREGAPSFGVYQQADTVWTVDADELCEVTPKPRDRIVDEEEQTWTILAATKSAVLNFWRFDTRNLAIAADLKDSITIEVPTIGQSATGAITRTWTVKYDAIAGRAQPIAEVDYTERGKQATAITIRIYLGQQVDPRNAALDWGRVSVNGGAPMNITTYTDAERITDLPYIEATLDP